MINNENDEQTRHENSLMKEKNRFIERIGDIEYESAKYLDILNALRNLSGMDVSIKRNQEHPGITLAYLQSDGQIISVNPWYNYVYTTEFFRNMGTEIWVSKQRVLPAKQGIIGKLFSKEKEVDSKSVDYVYENKGTYLEQKDISTVIKEAIGFRPFKIHSQEDCERIRKQIYGISEVNRTYLSNPFFQYFEKLGEQKTEIKSTSERNILQIMNKSEIDVKHIGYVTTVYVPWENK